MINYSTALVHAMFGLAHKRGPYLCWTRHPSRTPKYRRTQLFEYRGGEASTDARGHPTPYLWDSSIPPIPPPQCLLSCDFSRGEELQGGSVPHRVAGEDISPPFSIHLPCAGGVEGRGMYSLVACPSRSTTGVAVRKKKVRRKKEAAAYISEARKRRVRHAWTYQYTFPIDRTQLKWVGLDFA